MTSVCTETMLKFLEFRKDLNEEIRVYIYSSSRNFKNNIKNIKKDDTCFHYGRLNLLYIAITYLYKHQKVFVA